MAKAKTVAPEDVLESLTTAMELLEATRKEAGIPALEDLVDSLKAQMVSVMVKDDLEQVKGDGAHATLVKGTYGGMFLATSDDFRLLDEIPKDRKLIPLRTILRKKFKDDPILRMEIWNRITRRAVVQDQLDEVVSEGLLSVNEIAPAYIDKQKKPYVRVFFDG